MLYPRRQRSLHVGVYVYSLLCLCGVQPDPPCWGHVTADIFRGGRLQSGGCVVQQTQSLSGRDGYLFRESVGVSRLVVRLM